jgi:H+/Cl- antiporter ClcA
MAATLASVYSFPLTSILLLFGLAKDQLHDFAFFHGKC